MPSEELLIVVVFDEIQESIDLAIADNKVGANLAGDPRRSTLRATGRLPDSSGYWHISTPFHLIVGMTNSQTSDRKRCGRCLNALSPTDSAKAQRLVGRLATCVR